MKVWLPFLITTVGVATLPAQDVQIGYDLLGPARTSTQWQPNLSLWRELTSGRTNPPVNLGTTGLRASGPLLDAAATARRARGSQPTLGRALLSVPVGIASLFVPQPMPKAPESGGRYLAWRGESSSPWIHASAGVPAGPGLSDNPILREPKNGLLNFGWRDERKPELPLRPTVK